MDFSEDRERNDQSNQPVFVQPTVWEIELVRELGNFCRISVRISHSSTCWICWRVRHFAAVFHTIKTLIEQNWREKIVKFRKLTKIQLEIERSPAILGYLFTLDEEWKCYAIFFQCRSCRSMSWMTVDVNKCEVGCTNYIYTHSVIHGKSVAMRQIGELNYIRCDENVGIMLAILNACSCGW